MGNNIIESRSDHRRAASSTAASSSANHREQRGADPHSAGDPPEEVFESPFPSPFRSKFKNNTIRNNNYAIDDDDQLDEYELEGLMMTRFYNNNNRNNDARTPSSTTSRIGAGRVKSPFSQDELTILLAPVISFCHLAWDAKNRSKSAIALLFTLLLLFITLTKNDISGARAAGEGEVNKKPFHNGINWKHNTKNKSDPLSNLTPEQRHSLLVDTFGFWGFYDGSAEDRPSEPYMTVESVGNPYLDLNEENFPEESWQVDAVYVNHFLDAATKLVRRGQLAIFAAYHGYGLTNIAVEEDSDSGKVTGDVMDADERLQQRLSMFHLEEIDLSTVTTSEYLSLKEPEWKNKGGWTTARSFDGLERRLLHAMMTNSNFTIVVTGSWQSMGYGGNHGWQSMAGVIETLLGELFDRLGMRLVVRAIGLPPLSSDGLSVSSLEAADLLSGGRSTLVHTLGWSSIYGSDVDMVIWDDYGLDGKDGDEISAQLFDLFARQALLSGTSNLPFLWGGDFEVLRNLHEFADADVGQLGSGIFGVPETTNEKLAYNLPWAAQYLNCPNDKVQKACQKEEYQFDSQCWMGQSDVTPPTTQMDQIPIIPTAVGWRTHQIKGYTVSYTLLAALLDSLDAWSEKTIYEGHPLADDHWHMGDYIVNVQTKLRGLEEANAPHCFKLETTMNLPKRLCTNKLKGRTEYTPRANPSETSIRSIVLPPSAGGSGIQAEEKSALEGVDFVNAMGKVPEGEVDAVELLNITKQRLRQLYLQNRWLRARVGKKRSLSTRIGNFMSNLEFSIASTSGLRITRKFGSESSRVIHHGQELRRLDTNQISDEWQLLHSRPGENCDGSISSLTSCGVSPTSPCLLEGHQGSRGGIWGKESTGWLKMKITGMECGYVSLNLEVGGRAGDSRTRQLEIDAKDTAYDGGHQSESQPLEPPKSRSLNENLPDSFTFEYTVNDAVTKLGKYPFIEKLQHPMGGMTLMTIFDDSNSSTSKDITIAIRTTGCPEVECEVAVTHVYWC